MANSVIAIPSQYVVITTIVYTLLCSIFFEVDNALGKGETLVINNKTMMYSQQAIDEVETECKSPCPSSAEMCIEICE